MNNQLIQTICTLSPHGLQVQLQNGNILTIDPSINGYDGLCEKVGISDCIYEIKHKHAKLLLHSTSKLTEPILDGGKVPIVELAKKAFNGRYEVKEPHIGLDGVYCQVITKNHRITTIGFSFEAQSFFKTVDGVYKGFCPNQLELFNFMIAEGFNLFNLSEEYFTEKSTLNN